MYKLHEYNKIVVEERGLYTRDSLTVNLSHMNERNIEVYTIYIETYYKADSLSVLMLP